MSCQPTTVLWRHQRKMGMFVIWMSSALYSVFVHPDSGPSPHRANGSSSVDNYIHHTFTVHTQKHSDKHTHLTVTSTPPPSSSALPPPLTPQ